MTRLRRWRPLLAAPAPETRQRGAEVVAIADRRDAILHAIAAAGAGDVVLVAGKGHEKYQEIGGRVLPFDDVAVARLTVRAFSDGFLDGYLARAGEGALSSVGAYQLEGPGAQLFSQIEGDFFTILGLPLLELLAFLREHNAVLR